MKIFSPMTRGNGAYIVHKSLEQKIEGYRVVGYPPYWEALPLAMPFFISGKKSALIHTTPDYGIFFKQKRKPMVVTFHNYVLDPWMRMHSSFFQKMHYAADLRLWTRMSVAVADHITAVSRFCADRIEKDLQMHKPVEIIYNGVDETRFTPFKGRAFHDDQIRVFFSGNLTRRKGAHWLPDIASRLSDHVEIYFTEGLRTTAHIGHANNLVPVGRISFESMPDRYRQMDILIMPTVREGFGLAAAEAMACGLPVVASDCSSIPELIDDGKGGFLCPVGDVGAFAEKINLLAESPGLRKEMGQYNRAKVEKMFTLDRMVCRYKELFEEILDQGVGR